MAVIVEVADERYVDPARVQPLADMRHGSSGLVAIDGDAHELRAGAGKGCHLGHGGIDIRGVGIGHGLHHDWRSAPHNDAANIDRN